MNKQNWNTFYLIIASLAMVFSIYSRAEAEVIIKNVGKVNGQFLSSRQVQIFNIISQIIEPKKDTIETKNNKNKNENSDNQLIELNLNSPEFDGEAMAFLLETVIALEAENFNIVKVDKSEIDSAVKKVQDRTKDSGYWKSLVVSEPEVRKLVTQKIIAKNFIQFKTHSMTSVITDKEAKKYFDENRSKFSNLAFNDIKDSIKSFISKEQLQDRLRAWFEIIRKKYDVRVIR